MLKKMRGNLSPTAFAIALGTLNLFGCGYSQSEWDQKVRENEELRSNLAGEKSARDKAEADYADALEEIDALRAKLTERGMSVDTLSANLEAQRKALSEYESRLDRLDQIRRRFEELRQKLQQLTALGLKVDVRNNRMVIQLPGDVLFDSGSDKLKDAGEEILLQVAEVVRSDAELRRRQFQVAGHTDDRPLKGGRFVDNWGLSAMRARSVLMLLTTPEADDGGGLSPEKWSAAGYGPTDPVATNDTEEGRTKNRRVELVVQPDVAEMLNLNSLADPEQSAQ